PACHETIERRFCASCGEQKFDRHSFSLKHFAHHAAHEVFHFDSKILRTVRYLFTRPGFVTAEYLVGKKSRYMNPLRLYLLCFALVTLLASTYRPVLDIRTILQSDKTGKLNQKLEKFAASKGVSEEVILEHMKERLHIYYEVSQIFNVLMMAGLLAAVYSRRKWYFGEHAVTALYFLSFTFLLSMVKWPLWVAAGAPIQGARSYLLALVFLVIAVPYLWLILRRLHGEGPWKTALKSVVVYGGTQFMIILGTTLSFIFAVVHTILLP
ncbi:MAG TPA: DUF3667 domain-containing protein, partial [Candidatus Sulfotelmatobacter sp.]|nr:DUF3667 domain-containing protein [Candidatus Sulfotelmatobacter sp.]